MQKPVSYSRACYVTGENHERAVLRQLQEQGADFLLTAIDAFYGSQE